MQCPADISNNLPQKRNFTPTLYRRRVTLYRPRPYIIQNFECRHAFDLRGCPDQYNMTNEFPNVLILPVNQAVVVRRQFKCSKWIRTVMMDIRGRWTTRGPFVRVRRACVGASPLEQAMLQCALIDRGGGV